MPFCTACGSKNPDDARFCSQCGTRLVEASSERSEATGSGSSGAGATGSGSAGSEPTATIQIGDRAETFDQLSPVDAAAVDALPTGHALLVVQRGPGSGSRFLLDKDTVQAGRHPDSDIFLDDVTVSRRHASFERTGASFSVSDVGSLNGTYVNRDRIDKVVLKDGDEVQIGKFRLVFYAGHED